MLIDHNTETVLMCVCLHRCTCCLFPLKGNSGVAPHICLDHNTETVLMCMPTQVLVDLLPGSTDEHLFGPPALPCLPCFQPVLADFGEARAYHSTMDVLTTRNS